MYSVNLNGLSEKQLELVEQFANLLRKTNDRNKAAVTLRNLLSKQSGRLDPLTDEAVERLATEAVEYARS